MAGYGLDDALRSDLKTTGVLWRAYGGRMEATMDGIVSITAFARLMSMCQKKHPDPYLSALLPPFSYSLIAQLL